MGPETVTAIAACIERSRGFIPEGIKRAVIEELRAVVARDADVRTLDDWAAANIDAPPPVAACGPFVDWVVLVRRQAFRGATPDEARAKAAAWVREQTQKAGT